MKRPLIFLFAAIILFACNSKDKAPTSENEIDAARNFLDAALDGKWDNARTFLLQDSTNFQLMEAVENKYNNMTNTEKVSFMDAELRLYDSRNVNDSVTVVKYSNSYTNKKDSLKVIKINGQWLIDLKYTFFRTDSSANGQ